MKTWIMVGLSAFLMGIIACQAPSNGQDDTSDTDLVSGLGAVGNVMNGETAPNHFFPRIDCSTVTFGSCSGGSETKDFNGCTRGSSPSSLTVFGTISLAFTPSCPASYPPTLGGATETRTYAHHFYTDANGRSVITYDTNDSFVINSKTYSMSGLDLKDFGGTTRSGGSVMSFTNATTRSVTINGIHRRSILPSGVLGYWHTIYTPNPISISVSGAQKTLNGSFVLSHNRARVTVTNSFSNLAFSTGCNFPSSGTDTILIQTESGVTRTLSAAFTGACGTVAITENGSTYNLTLTGGT